MWKQYLSQALFLFQTLRPIAIEVVTFGGMVVFCGISALCALSPGGPALPCVNLKSSARPLYNTQQVPATKETILIKSHTIYIVVY